MTDIFKGPFDHWHNGRLEKILLGHFIFRDPQLFREREFFDKLKKIHIFLQIQSSSIKKRIIIIRVIID